MAVKFFIVLCASALLIQKIAAIPVCGCGVGNNADIAAAGLLGAEIAAANNFIPPPFIPAPVYGTPFAPGPVFAPPVPTFAPATIFPGPAFAPVNGGSFTVSMTSPIAPRGVSVVSENSIDGTLEIIGSLPLLATVAVEGKVPSTGAAGTSYGCGSGNVGISGESLAAVGLGGYDALGLGGYGLGAAGLSVPGLGAAGLSVPGLNAAITGAELASINAGFAGVPFVPSFGSGCGSNLIVY